MGMFDTIKFHCPNCGNEIEEQTKAGGCMLETFSSNKVPTEIAVQMAGDRIRCDMCHREYYMRIELPKTTEIELIEIK